MKKNCFLMLSVGIFLSHFALSQNYTLASSTQMSPGIIYQKYTITTPRPVQIHVLQTDLKDPTVKLQSAKAGGVINGGVQTVKAIAASKDINEQYHNVIGAINGDFYVTSGTSEGNPENLLIADGQIFAHKIGSQNKTVFGISGDNNPFISLRGEQYRVNKAGVYRTIHKINTTRTNDTLVLYNQFKGNSTGTDNTGTEVKLQLLSGQTWKANGTVQCRVAAKSTSGNMSISAGEAVLSGKGTEATYLNSFALNEVVELELNAAFNVSNIVQVMGGFPRLVTDGANTANSDILTEGGTLAQANAVNPRTGVGVSQDERFLYMVVVDGRDPGISEGMSMSELANLMIYLGAYNAVNLDGGWSSTLVANNLVRNVPSDGGANHGVERQVGSALLSYSTTQLLESFEINEGRFDKAPTYTLGTQYTVGIATTSTMDRVTTTSCSGVGSERAILNDDPGVSTPWTVRLLSGSGIPSNNVKIASNGTISFWLKTSTAQPGATVQVWFDDSDGAEASPALTILNDGQWHQYSFDLTSYNGTTITTGNGQLDADSVTLDAIVLKQPNTASSWTVYFDDVAHDRTASGTKVSSQNRVLDDFEVNVGHFDQAPTNTAGTQYTVGISTTSTLQRVTTEKHRGVGGLRAVLIDDAASSNNWTVRLMSGSGIPSNNTKITSDGTLSFWMKTSTAQPGATVQVWFDDSDGAEASAPLSVINDGQWHLYNFDLDNFNGTTITTGNGQLNASLVTLDAIVLKQPNTSSTWTVYFDDVQHLAVGTNPGTSTQKTSKNDNRDVDVSTDDPDLVSPNPSRGVIFVNLPPNNAETYQVNIVDLQGKTVLAKNLSAGRQRIDARGLATGMYIIQVQSKQVTKTAKVIIQN